MDFILAHGFSTQQINDFASNGTLANSLHADKVFVESPVAKSGPVDGLTHNNDRQVSTFGKLETFTATNNSFEVGGSSKRPLEDVEIPSSITTGEANKGKPSWSSVVANVHPVRTALKFFPPSERDGHLLIKPPSDMLIKGYQMWSFSLVGYFLHSKLPFKVVEPAVSKLWGSLGLAKVLLHPKGYYIFKFNSAAERDNVLAMGPWYISNKQILLKPWKDGIDITRETCTKAPIWVKLHNVPYAYWSEDGLGYIASGIGKPLFLDNETAKLIPLPFARLCIEIEFGAALPKTIPVVVCNGLNEGAEEILEVVVEYQSRPQACSVCKTFGHSTLKCPAANFQWVPKSTAGKEDVIEPGNQLSSNSGKLEVMISDKKLSSPAATVAHISVGTPVLGISDTEGWAHVGKSIPYAPILAETNQVQASNQFDVLMESAANSPGSDMSPSPNPLVNKLKMIDEKEVRDIKLKARICDTSGQNSKKKNKRGGSKPLSPAKTS